MKQKRVELVKWSGGVECPEELPPPYPGRNRSTTVPFDSAVLFLIKRHADRIGVSTTRWVNDALRAAICLVDRSGLEAILEAGELPDEVMSPEREAWVRKFDKRTLSSAPVSMLSYRT